MSELKPYMTTGNGQVLYHETIVIALQERISRLEAIIDAAPHEGECDRDWRLGRESVCDCWKSKV